MLNIQEAGQNEEIMSSINDSLFILQIHAVSFIRNAL